MVIACIDGCAAAPEGRESKATVGKSHGREKPRHRFLPGSANVRAAANESLGNATCPPIVQLELLVLLSEPCAGSLWQAALAESLPRSAIEDSESPLAYINVGANKGYNIAEFLSIWTNKPVTNGVWHKHIKRFASEVKSATLSTQAYVSCGVCGVCHAITRPARPRAAKVVAHAFELLPQNQRLLQYVTTASGMGSVINVHPMAVSNHTGQMPFIKYPSSTYGKEGTALCASAGSCALSSVAMRSWLRKTKATMITANITTVDEFMRREALREAFMVSIDVEGFDPLVLEGMRQTIESKRVQIFEFEHGNKGFWREDKGAEQRTLRAMAEGWLSKAGYTCYWETYKGRLVPVLGKCWATALLEQASPHTLHWSNVVCAHERSTLDVFERHPVAAKPADVAEDYCWSRARNDRLNKQTAMNACLQRIAPTVSSVECCLRTQLP